jgi:hypothetical protein
MRWTGLVVCMTEMRNAYKVLVGKRPLGRPRHRWEENIKMDLGKKGLVGVDWIDLTQDRN